MKKTIYISCPITTRSGYGTHSRILVKSLIQLKDQFDITIIPTRWGTTPTDVNVDEFKDYFAKSNLTVKPDIWIQVTVPNEFSPMGIYNIGVTALTETSVCSLDMLTGCNKMDKIIVPSEFTKNVLLNTIIERVDSNTKQVIETIKFNKEVDVLFEGLDTTIFNKSLPLLKSVNDFMTGVEEDFVFLCVGHWLEGVMGEDRKNISMVVKVFLEAFRKKPSNKRPALLLKTSGAGFSEVEKYEILKKIDIIRSEYKDLGGKLPNIYLLNGDLTDQQMNALYNHPKVKAMVSFTKAEGFGLPLLEFTSTGKPILASKYSGHLDFLPENMTVLLPGTMTKIHPSAANEWLVKDSEWFTVNYNLATQYLQDVYENYDKYLEKSRKLPKNTKDNFTIGVMTDKFSEILDKINKPKTIKLSLPNLLKNDE